MYMYYEKKNRYDNFVYIISCWALNCGLEFIGHNNNDQLLVIAEDLFDKYTFEETTIAYNVLADDINTQ